MTFTPTRREIYAAKRLANEVIRLRQAMDWASAFQASTAAFTLSKRVAARSAK